MRGLTPSSDEMKITADDKVAGQATVEMVLTIYFDAARKVAVAQMIGDWKLIGEI